MNDGDKVRLTDKGLLNTRLITARLVREGRPNIFTVRHFRDGVNGKVVVIEECCGKLGCLQHPAHFFEVLSEKDLKRLEKESEKFLTSYYVEALNDKGKMVYLKITVNRHNRIEDIEEVSKVPANLESMTVKLKEREG